MSTSSSPAKFGRRAAVLGAPIAHSLSPALHRAAYLHLGLDWQYDAIEVTAEQVVDFVTCCGPEWVGLSLTMPLKEAVLPALAQMTPTVALSKSANTVIFGEAGPMGHNTDVTGFMNALSEHHIVRVETAAILGSGATARSALLALQQMGASEVTLVGRMGDSLPRCVALAQELGLRVAVHPWEGAIEAIGAPLVINTAPASAGARLSEQVPAPVGLLFEVLYDPRPTPLADAWARRGGQVIGGLDLLVHQAVEQVALMTGQRVSAEVLRQAL